ncbi:MAG: DNA mismatch repair endonuclease MutL [Treponemataceae bacterium]
MQNIHRPVRILSSEVARKIAAGEVIDRPNAIVRELLDNAVDSGASYISLEIEGGGIEKIRVTDDGCGMTKEDLQSSILPHATSKIISEQDLLSLDTLGFRGEALASIAAVSRLEISSRRENQTAWKLEAQLTCDNILTPCSLDKGTVVESKAVFENFPARRVFLKRAGTEGNLCKQTFIEKALSYPKINFKFFTDKKLRMDLPATESKIQRLIQALELIEDEKLFHCIQAQDTENMMWDFDLIIGDNSIYRNDKKNIHIFVNGRKISEYSLVQAIEYGVQGSFPNGTHPIACLFLRIDPKLVDFNIHPAKKEARFKDLSVIHHAISSRTRSEFLVVNKKEMFDSTEFRTEKSDFFKEFDFDEKLSENQNSKISQNPNNSFSKIQNLESEQEKNENFIPEQNFFTSKKSYNNFSSVCKISENNDKINYKDEYDFKYLGSAFNVFLFAEKDQKVFVIDQHAGHERILYEQLMKNSGQKQPLLFPYEIIPETEEQSSYLDSIQEQMDMAGFSVEKTQKNTWLITSVPIKWQGTKQDLTEAVFEKHYKPNEFMHHFLATCACKAAIKEGHYLDCESAKKLIKNIFELTDPHCPHGRPIWFILSREEMYQRVKRT